MKNYYRFGAVCALLLAGFSGHAQEWTQLRNDPQANFYDVQQAFEAYWKDRPYERGQGYKQFRRWENDVAPRVYPSGDRSLLSRTWPEFQKYLQQNPGARTAAAGNWTFLGPVSRDSLIGVGRINFVRIDPSHHNTLYVGSPGGGLWKTTNAGQSWTPLSDELIVLGAADVAIDYTNANVLYMATGDADASDTYSIGVLKSTDGGASWNPTGLAWNVSQSRNIHRLLMHPTNPNVLLASTSVGIYRTTDGGTTWALVSNTPRVRDMEFKPGDPSVIYGVGSRFLKSTDGGATFATSGTGIPASGVERMAIGVTPANPDYVYVVASESSNSSFKGLYRSVDGGNTFATRSTTPNIFTSNAAGTGTYGQTWYNLAIAVSPVDAEQVIVGAVINWRSNDGGQTWSNYTQAYGGNAPYAHPDVHSLEFMPGSPDTLFIGCDGGIYRTVNRGQSFTDISSNLHIGQLYRMGQSATNANAMYSGWQDNGANYTNGTRWWTAIYADGMEGFIDPTNDNIIYGSSQYGNLRISRNGGASWSAISNTISETGAWTTPWQLHPTNPQIVYAGFDNLWVSANRGSSWTRQVVPGGGKINVLRVAPSNPDVLYVTKGLSALYRSNDGGSTWRGIASGLGNAVLTDVAVDPLDPHHIWVTCSGYNATLKVFESTSGGNTWRNLSAGLPNLPVNCILHQAGSDGLVYAGTDVGVYYRDRSMSTWLPFFNGLPNVRVNELEIFYPTGKIRAATYGRGIWESDILPALTPQAAAQFTASNTTICPGDSVVFTDVTPGSSARTWTFPGGTPATSTAQTVTVTYATAGASYNVTLAAVLPGGTTSTRTDSSYVRVYGLPNVNLAALNAVCSTAPGFPLSGGTPLGGRYAGPGVSGTGPYTFDPAVAGLGSHPITYTFAHPATGCENTAQQLLTVSICTGVAEEVLAQSLQLYPNPTNGLVQLTFEAGASKPLQVRLTDLLGRVVFEEQRQSFSGTYRHELDLSKHSAGMYLLQVRHGELVLNRSLTLQR